MYQYKSLFYQQQFIIDLFTEIQYAIDFHNSICYTYILLTSNTKAVFVINRTIQGQAIFPSLCRKVKIFQYLHL